MPDNFESIIKDLYELDPSLRSEDKAVREVVASLLANKPVVLPDQEYVADLRAKLLLAHSAQFETPKAIPSPWLMYLVPVGVVAVLVFMLVPRPLSHQTVPTIVNEDTELDSSAASQSESSDEATDFKRSFMAPEVAPASDMRTMETSPAETQLNINSTVPLPEWNSFGIQNQLPGNSVMVDFVSFREKSEIAIYRQNPSGELEFLGLSAEIPAGFNEGVKIMLNKKIGINELLIAIPFFIGPQSSPSTSLPEYDRVSVYDQFGQELRQVFYVVPEN